MKKKIILFGLVSNLLLYSCNKGSGEVDPFDRTLILKNIAENLIVPNYHKFHDEATLLVSAASQFADNPSEENLDNVQQNWLQARLSWKACEAFSFGPIENLGLETSIDLFPVTETGIEEAIENYNGAENYLISIGSNRKGFAAIEYLLFHDDHSIILEEFEQENRQSYLKLLAIDLETIASKIVTAWQGEYYNHFINDGSNSAGASITVLTNEYIFLIEKIKNFKVATPLGLIGSGDPLPEKVESYYAKKSLEMINKDLELIDQIFTGMDGNGFDDYLNELNITDADNGLLADAIIAQIERCFFASNSISVPLQEAVINEKANVEQLFVELQKLTVLIKTDMMSQLGLLVTFSDNDGD